MTTKGISLEGNISNIIAPFLFKESKDTETVMNIKMVYFSTMVHNSVIMKIIKQNNNTYRIESELIKAKVNTIDQIIDIYDFHINYINNEIESEYNADDEDSICRYVYKVKLQSNNIFIKPEYISEGDALKKFIKNSWELENKLSKK
jgi:hypothetical protein